MDSTEALLGLPDFRITQIERQGHDLRVGVEFTGPVSCPNCGGSNLRNKGKRPRQIRHESFGNRHVVLEVAARKWKCRECGHYFHQRFPGILRCQRATEAFRRQIYELHYDGINRSRLGRRENIAPATVERHFQHFLRRQAAELEGATCPRILGIDEHFFSRKRGYATTFCDLTKHRVFDVVLGRSEAALEKYLSTLKGKQQVRVVCMDLSSTYRAVVRKHFPNAIIVTDRFHVIRLVYQHFLALWRLLDPVGAKNRGLLSLLRRHARNLSAGQQDKLRQYLELHPALKAAYDFKEQLVQLLLLRSRTARQCRKLIPCLIDYVEQLRSSGFQAMQILGHTLHTWLQEIARMWRFTRSNGITEGFHTKMEAMQRQAYGFRNFRSYRLRVVVMCR